METKKIIIEIDGKRHRMVRGKVSGDMCSKCSLADLCTEVVGSPCLDSLDYFVIDKQKDEQLKQYLLQKRDGLKWRSDIIGKYHDVCTELINEIIKNIEDQ